MISPKTYWAALLGMASVLFWTIAVVTFWKGTFTNEELAALTTVTTAVAASFAAYLAPDKGYVHARSLVEHPRESKLGAEERVPKT